MDLAVLGLQLDMMILRVFFQPKQFHDSIKPLFFS